MYKKWKRFRKNRPKPYFSKSYRGWNTCTTITSCSGTSNFRTFSSIPRVVSRSLISASPNPTLKRMKSPTLIVEVQSTWLQKCLPSNSLLIQGPAIPIKSTTTLWEFYFMSSSLEGLRSTHPKRKISFFPFSILSPNSQNLLLSQNKSRPSSRVFLPKTPTIALALWKASKKSVPTLGFVDTLANKRIRYLSCSQV